MMPRAPRFDPAVVVTLSGSPEDRLRQAIALRLATVAEDVALGDREDAEARRLAQVLAEGLRNGLPGYLHRFEARPAPVWESHHFHAVAPSRPWTHITATDGYDPDALWVVDLSETCLVVDARRGELLVRVPARRSVAQRLVDFLCKRARWMLVPWRPAMQDLSAPIVIDALLRAIERQATRVEVAAQAVRQRRLDLAKASSVRAPASVGDTLPAPETLLATGPIAEVLAQVGRSAETPLLTGA